MGAMRVRRKKSKIQTWEKMRSKLRTIFCPSRTFMIRSVIKLTKLNINKKPNHARNIFPNLQLYPLPSHKKKSLSPRYTPFHPQKELAPQKNQIGLEASEEVVKVVNENEDEDGNVVGFE